MSLYFIVLTRYFTIALEVISKTMAEEEDPYAVSSDSDDETKRKPPPKIQIEGRENDINQLVGPPLYPLSEAPPFRRYFKVYK